jgi:hypothetical protein
MALIIPGFQQCVPPPELYKDERVRGALGKQAEDAVFFDLLGSPAALGIADIFPDPGERRSKSALAQFLGEHFGIDNEDKRKLEKGDYKIPDFITFRTPIGLNEWYEVKPHSASGIQEAWKKENNIKKKLLPNFNLDKAIAAGSMYAPNKNISVTALPSVSVGLYEFEAFALHIFKERDGIIFYRVCFRIRLRVPVAEMVATVALALVAFMLLQALAPLLLAPGIVLV